MAYTFPQLDTDAIDSLCQDVVETLKDLGLKINISSTDFLEVALDLQEARQQDTKFDLVDFKEEVEEEEDMEEEEDVEEEEEPKASEKEGVQKSPSDCAEPASLPRKRKRKEALQSKEELPEEPQKPVLDLLSQELRELDSETVPLSLIRKRRRITSATAGLKKARVVLKRVDAGPMPAGLKVSKFIPIRSNGTWCPNLATPQPRIDPEKAKQIVGKRYEVGNIGKAKVVFEENADQYETEELRKLKPKPIVVQSSKKSPKSEESWRSLRKAKAKVVFENVQDKSKDESEDEHFSSEDDETSPTPPIAKSKRKNRKEALKVKDEQPSEESEESEEEAKEKRKGSDPLETPKYRAILPKPSVAPPELAVQDEIVSLEDFTQINFNPKATVTKTIGLSDAEARLQNKQEHLKWQKERTAKVSPAEAKQMAEKIVKWQSESKTKERSAKSHTQFIRHDLLTAPSTSASKPSDTESSKALAQNWKLSLSNPKKVNQTDFIKTDLTISKTPGGPVTPVFVRKPIGQPPLLAAPATLNGVASQPQTLRQPAPMVVRMQLPQKVWPLSKFFPICF